MQRRAVVFGPISRPRYPKNIVAKAVLAALVLSALGLLGWTYVWPQISVPKASVYKIVAVGDLVCGEESPGYNAGKGTPQQCRSQQVADLAREQSPAAYLLLGDLQYSKGQSKYFREIFDKSWGPVKGRILPTPGNHDYYEDNKATGYFDYFNGQGKKNGVAGKRDEGYYARTIGNWRLISLNTNCERVGGCGPGTKQYQWLQNELARNPSKCTLAFWHQPHYTSGITHTPEDTDRSGGFWDLLYSARAEVVLNGHEHYYERFAPQDNSGKATADGIVQFIAGTGGFSHSRPETASTNSRFLDGDHFGVLVMYLEDNRFSWQYITEDRAVLDSGTRECIK